MENSHSTSYKKDLDKLEQIIYIKKYEDVIKDELKVAETEIQKITDKNIEEIDKILTDKETEIMSV